VWGGRLRGRPRNGRGGICRTLPYSAPQDWEYRSNLPGCKASPGTACWASPMACPAPRSRLYQVYLVEQAARATPLRVGQPQPIRSSRGVGTQHNVQGPVHPQRQLFHQIHHRSTIGDLRQGREFRSHQLQRALSQHHSSLVARGPQHQRARLHPLPPTGREAPQRPPLRAPPRSACTPPLPRLARKVDRSRLTSYFRSCVAGRRADAHGGPAEPPHCGGSGAGRRAPSASVRPGGTAHCSGCVPGSSRCR
jgi:hypothetical protein